MDTQCKNLTVYRWCDRKLAVQFGKKLEDQSKVFGGTVVQVADVLSSCKKKEEFVLEIPSQEYTKTQLKSISRLVDHNKLGMAESLC